MNGVPMPVFSGTTALVLFAIYLRLRGRLNNVQLAICIVIALAIGYAIYKIQLSAAVVTPNAIA
jgi:hypothetical protein